MSLCKICSSLDLGSPNSKSNEGEKGVRLGSYSSLIQRSSSEGCENCAFFLKILHTSSSYEGSIEYLEDKIIYLYSKRLDVRRVGREDTCTWGCDDLLFDICVREDDEGPKDPEIDIRRIIPEDLLHEKCVSKITSWWDECSSTHESCSNVRDVVLPHRIIEIPADEALPPTLVTPDGGTGQYVVLSYCRNEEEDHKFTSEDLNDFESGIDVAALPQVFKDAIAVTRRLGFRYLWLDSICNTQEKTFPAPNFVSIYGNAALMLSADSSPDTSTSFLQPRTVLYSPPLGKDRNRFYRLRLLRWKDDINYSPLAKQLPSALERIFAPRIVHFTKRQVIWECATTWRYEASGVEDKTYGSGQVRMNFRKEFVQPYLSEGFGKQEIVVGDGNEKEKLEQRLEVWHSCADEFSRRTKGNLDAKMKIASHLARVLDDGSLGDYLGGVWSKDIIFGLTWARQNNVLTASSQYRAPSWSWGSVDGSINTCFLITQEGGAEEMEWNEKHLPKLVSHDMIPLDPKDPYLGVKEGSSITLSGSFSPFMKVAEAFSFSRGMDVTMNPILDQSPMFDCSCCLPRPESVQKQEAEKFEKNVDHHVVLVLGRETSEKENIKSVDCLILRAVVGREGTYERVGLAVLSIYDHGKDGGKESVGKLIERFNEVEWVRREVVLI